MRNIAVVHFLSFFRVTEEIRVNDTAATSCLSSIFTDHDVTIITVQQFSGP